MPKATRRLRSVLCCIHPPRCGPCCLTPELICDRVRAALSLAWSSEVQHVPVCIRDLEPTQIIRVHAEWLMERYATGCELVGQRVGIWRIDIRIPSRPAMPARIRHRLHLGGDGLEHQ